MKKQMMILAALLIAPSAFALPKVGSKATIKATISVEGQTITSEASVQATEMDASRDHYKFVTKLDVMGEEVIEESDVKISFMQACYDLPKKCDLANAEKAMSLDVDSDQVLAAAPDTIQTIYGALATCKVTQIGMDGSQSTTWVADKAFGFVRMDSDGLSMELTGYTE